MLTAALDTCGEPLEDKDTLDKRWGEYFEGLLNKKQGRKRGRKGGSSREKGKRSFQSESLFKKIGKNDQSEDKIFQDNMLGWLAKGPSHQFQGLIHKERR